MSFTTRRKYTKNVPFTTVQVNPETQLVAPAHPWPPHCPYSATVPAVELPVGGAAEELLAGGGFALDELMGFAVDCRT